MAFEDGDGSDGSEDEAAIALAEAAAVEAIAETVEVEAVAAEVEPAEAEPETGSMEPAAIAEPESDPSTSWGEPAASRPVGRRGHRAGTPMAPRRPSRPTTTRPRWAAGETPDGFPAGDEAR